MLLDVITGDQRWAAWSAREIAAAMDTGRVYFPTIAIIAPAPPEDDTAG